MGVTSLAQACGGVAILLHRSLGSSRVRGVIGGALYVAAYEGAAVSNHMYEPRGEERDDYLVCVLLLGSGATAFRRHEEMVPIRAGHAFLANRRLPELME